MKLVKRNKIVLQNNHNLEKNRMMESDEDEKQSKLNDVLYIYLYTYIQIY